MLLLTVTEFRNNISKYIKLAGTERVSIKSKDGIFDLVPNKEIRVNPSPSGDPYFDNKNNVYELNNRLADIESGKVAPISWSEAKAQLGL